MAVSADEVEVLSQNRAFYAAFLNRDLASMENLWARLVEVACIHPGWQVIRGRQQVMASWQAILGQENAPKIHCDGATASIFGETALVLCEEVLDDGRLVASNLFVREDGEWRLCHHQAGPLASSILTTEEDDEDELDADDSEPAELVFSASIRPPRRLLN